MRRPSRASKPLRRPQPQLHTHLTRPVVVQVGEGHLVLGADGAADDELVDVVELVPVLIARVHVPEHGLKLGAARDAHVQALQAHTHIKVPVSDVAPLRLGGTTG